MKKPSKMKAEPTNLDQQLEQLKHSSPRNCASDGKRCSVRLRRRNFVRR